MNSSVKGLTKKAIFDLTSQSEMKVVGAAQMSGAIFMLWVLFFGGWYFQTYVSLTIDQT